MTPDDSGLPPFLSPKQVSEYFQVTPRTIVKWIQDGTLVAIKTSNRWRVTRESILDLASDTYGPKGHPEPALTPEPNMRGEG